MLFDLNTLRSLVLIGSIVITLLPAFADAETEKNEVIWVAAETFLGEPGAHKMAYLMSEKYKAQQEARELYKNDPSLQANHVVKKMKEAEYNVASDAYRNRYYEAAVKDIVDMTADGLAQNKKVPPLPKNLAQVAIKDIMDMIPAEGDKSDLMDPTYVKMMTGYVLTAARDPNHPDHANAKAMAEKWLKVDTKVPYEFLPAVRAEYRNQALEKKIEQLRLVIEDGLKNGITKEDLEKHQKESVALMQEMQAAIVEATKEIKETPTQKDIRERKERAELWRGRFTEISRGFGAIAGIAQLAKADPKTIQIFQKSAALAEGIGSIVEVTITKSFSDNPMTYANVYVAGAVLLTNLMQSGSEQSEAAMMMEQLNKISQQIEELRIEIMKHFDLLDLNMRVYFEKSFFELQNINQSALRLEQSSRKLLKEIKDARFESTTGLRALFNQDLTNWQTTCLSTLRSKQSAQSKRQAVLSCRNYFAQISMMSWEVALKDNAANGTTLFELMKISQEDTDAIRDFLSSNSQDTEIFEGGAHPLNWILGVSNFLKLFQLNPNHVDLAPIPYVEGRPDLDLASIIKRGVKLQQSLETLVLEKQGQNFVLKNDLVSKLLEEYLKRASESIAYGKQLAAQRAQSGPRSLAELKTPPLDGDYPFLKKKMWFCDPKKAKVGTHAIDKQFVYDPQNMVPKYFHALNPAWFDLHKSIVPLIPTEAAWGERMVVNGKIGLDGITIEPCIQSFEFTEFQDSYKQMRLGYKMVIDIRANFTYPSPTKEPVLISRAEASEVKVISNYIFNFNPECPIPLVWNIWVGQQQVCNRGGTFAWAPLRDHMELFKPVPLERVDPVWKSYQDRFRNRLITNERLAKRDIENDLPTVVGSDSKKTLIQLLKLGVDPNNIVFSDFLNWLVLPDSLPPLNELANIALTTPITEDEISQLVEKRTAIVFERLKSIEQEKSLQPRHQETQELLNKLRGLQ